MALTSPLDLQQAHALGRYDEQGQAKPTRETAVATSAYPCPDRSPTSDCARLGGSGEHPTWTAEGASQTQTTARPLLLQQAAAAALQTYQPAAIKEACRVQASLEKKREDGQGTFGPSPRISQTVTILTLGWDTAIAAFLLTAAQLLENASLVDFSPTT